MLVRIVFLLTLLFSVSTHAAEICEKALQDAFSAEPQGVNGYITDAFPMTPQTLVAAYTRGIFPWSLTEDGTRAEWYSLPMRGILRFEDLHPTKSDMRWIRRELAGTTYRVSFNEAFEQVMQECAAMTRKDSGQWIMPEFIAAYKELQRQGNAHSVEVWKGDELVGGLYGVFAGGVFAGESMFHKESNVAKLALWTLIERLKSKGHTWMDTQQAPEAEKGSLATGSLASKWGAKEIPRADFLKLLQETQALGLEF